MSNTSLEDSLGKDCKIPGVNAKPWGLSSAIALGNPWGSYAFLRIFAKSIGGSLGEFGQVFVHVRRILGALLTLVRLTLGMFGEVT